MKKIEALVLLGEDWCKSIDGDVLGFPRRDSGIVSANEKGTTEFTVLGSLEGKNYRCEYFRPWEHNYSTLADVNGKVEFHEVEVEVEHEIVWKKVD